MTKLEGLNGHIIVQVAAGDYHTIALTSEGAVFTFGSNDSGRTGHGTTEGNQTTPRKVGGCLEGKKVVYVAAGFCHTACIDEDGETYTWGLGDAGRLGHGDETNLSSPRAVDGLIGKKASAVACGGYHTLVIVGNGKVYSFGYGKSGQLGHGDTQNKLTPILIQAPFGGKIIMQVACGSTHSMALSSEGWLYTWGHGKYGKLGHGSSPGDYQDYPIPTRVESLSGYKVVNVATYNSHSIVLVEPKDSYAINMKAMIDDESCSDVVFVLKDDNDEQVHAQKGVLVAQSEYFRAMFRNDMKEARENVVEVRDCSRHLLMLFLEYLYTRSIFHLEDDLENTMELYALAHRYQAVDLCKRCVEAIEKCLTKQNYVNLLLKADRMGPCFDVIKTKIINRVTVNVKSLDEA